MSKIDVPPEVRAYFAAIGRRNGEKLKRERGSEYFRKIAGMRKTFGRQSKSGITGVSTYQSLANTYQVTRQRVQQIIKNYGQNLADRTDFPDEGSWRAAVMKQYYSVVIKTNTTTTKNTAK